MAHNVENMEKLLPSAEEEEVSEDEKEEVDGDDDDEEEEEEGEEDNEEKEAGDGEDKGEKAADKTEKNTPAAPQPKDSKQTGVLNLNNEVVNMRKEVRRVRTLIIRKMIRQMASLKKRKGKEADVEKNQKRAGRLLEEIHAMKALTPDLVTKTALQKSLNFEQVCKNPKSTFSDRAIARIATHPQFSKKIDTIKAAVEAFKEERMKGGKPREKEKVPNKAGKLNAQSKPDKREERGTEKEQEDITVQPQETEKTGKNEEEGVLKEVKDATVTNPEKETGKPAATVNVQKKKQPKSKVVTPPSTKTCEVKNAVRNEPGSEDTAKHPDPAVAHTKEDEEESDLESSDEEEKEYFDDSTEERFKKQSSQSEESDDDFFVGKVSKFKKKKPKSADGEKNIARGPEVKGGSADEPNAPDKLQSQLDELESRLKSKAKPQSVFCSSLSGSKQNRGGGGRGRGGDRFRDQGKPRGGGGLNRGFSKQSNFQNEVTGAERNTGSKYSKPCPEGRGRGRGRDRGRGRGDVRRQNVGGGGFTHQPPQQSLHPSWEASKKRKEQQGQILAFQGKKIKFDDDD